MLDGGAGDDLLFGGVLPAPLKVEQVKTVFRVSELSKEVKVMTPCWEEVTIA